MAADTPFADPSAARLRILATTDLHGHILPHDYIKNQPTQGGGLAGLSRLIAEARAQAEAADRATFLFDNGDTFQGTPLASLLAAEPVTPDHPIIASLNSLGYDALGLGNHDLDHGLDYLKEVSSHLEMPILNSNLHCIERAPWQDRLLIPVIPHENAPAPLTLGILSVLPMQSAAWHAHHLGNKTAVSKPVDSVRVFAQALKAAGADIIVVLAHMGVGTASAIDTDMQASYALVKTGEIDALFLGHTHQRMPSSDYANRQGVDLAASTVCGVPCVMAGHAGSDLAVMDLDLTYDAGTGWRIISHACSLRPNGGNVVPDPVICRFVEKRHQAVVAHLDEPVAKIRREIHSFFAPARPSPTQHLAARAHFDIIRAALAGTPDATLPLLATAAAIGAGGRDGLGNYHHIPEGPVLRRHIAGLNPYTDQAVGIRICGSDILKWLEHAAVLFNTLQQDAPDQMLSDPNVPAFQFDTIYGLDYEIDPTRPPRHRISNVCYRGRPIEHGEKFILATNQFRVAGGGGYGPTDITKIATVSTEPIQNSMIAILNSKDAGPWSEKDPWQFKSKTTVQAILLTHPDALHALGDIRHLQPKLAGTSKEGFLRVQITL